MKLFALAFVSVSLIIGSVAHAEDAYLIGNTRGTKVQALMALLKDPNAEVYKLTPQMITKKATLKKKGSDNE